MSGRRRDAGLLAAVIREVAIVALARVVAGNPWANGGGRSALVFRRRRHSAGRAGQIGQPRRNLKADGWGAAPLRATMTQAA